MHPPNRPPDEILPGPAGAPPGMVSITERWLLTPEEKAAVAGNFVPVWRYHEDQADREPAPAAAPPTWDEFLAQPHGTIVVEPLPPGPALDPVTGVPVGDLAAWMEANPGKTPPAGPWFIEKGWRP